MRREKLQIDFKKSPITKLTIRMSNVDNSENSENIIAFENVEFFEYVQETHMTELDVHKSLSSVLRRCSRFGLRHDSSLPKEEKEEVEERNRTEILPKTLEQLRIDSTLPMTQLSISSGSLENMLDVVSTILMNVLERMKRGGSSRENHVFPEDLFKYLETRIDKIVEEQNTIMENNLKHQTSDSVSDVQAKFDKFTISATSQSIAMEEQSMLIRSTVGVNSSVRVVFERGVGEYYSLSIYILESTHFLLLFALELPKVTLLYISSENHSKIPTFTLEHRYFSILVSRQERQHGKWNLWKTRHLSVHVSVQPQNLSRTVRTSDRRTCGCIDVTTDSSTTEVHHPEENARESRRVTSYVWSWTWISEHFDTLWTVRIRVCVLPI